MDDEDEYLYGDTEANDSSMSHDEASHLTPQQRVREFFRERKASYWLALVRQNGTLEIYSVPDMQLNFSAIDLHLGHRLLNHHEPNTGTTPVSTASSVDVIEIGIFGLGHLQRRPLMILRTADCQVFIYEAVIFYDGTEGRHLKMRFRKLSHNMLLKEKKTP